MRLLRLGFLLVCLGAASCGAQECRVRGEVKDSSGAVVSGAIVRRGTIQTMTDATGHFDLAGVCRGAVEVRARGFAPEHIQVLQPATEIEVRLRVSLIEERITVESEGGSATSMNFESTDLRTSPELTLDSQLRAVPGFSLFRRTPSWSANPTTQGVSLHGVGASGASRGLVLLDGVPLNDPFGGWIYWGRAATATVGGAEVSEASASNLYGSDAVGGVVNLQRAEPTTHATVETSVGNLFTPSGSAVAGVNFGKWNASFVGDGFRTNGYVPVPGDLRGPVDTVSSSQHGNGGARLERSRTHGRAFVGASLYGESRQNGTVLQTNSATVREFEAGGDWLGARAGDWSLRGFGGTEGLRQTFTSINSTRTAESLTRDQTVPAAQAGATLLWTKAAGRNLLVGGGEARWVDGESYEWAFLSGIKSSIVRSGGGQLREGVFGEDRIRIGSRALVTVGARYDHWSNEHGWTSTQGLLAGATNKYTPYANRTEDAFSPKVGLSYRASRWLTLTASAAQGFRAPTLNELYRSFRVGNVLTSANAALKAEHSTNVEGGAAVGLGRAGTVRASYFWTDLRDAVSNVTQSVTPALITRQRQNLGRLRSRGVDAAWETRVGKRWTVNAAYEFADPTVVEFAADPTLVGLWIPQVARHNASFTTTYAGAKFTAHATARFQGKQFDDDRNTLPLASYAVVDAYFARMLGHGLEAFVAGENLTNKRYDVGRTPVLTVGPPVVARVGLRWTLGR